MCCSVLAKILVFLKQGAPHEWHATRRHRQQRRPRSYKSIDRGGLVTVCPGLLFTRSHHLLLHRRLLSTCHLRPANRSPCPGGSHKPARRQGLRLQVSLMRQRARALTGCAFQGVPTDRERISEPRPLGGRGGHPAGHLPRRPSSGQRGPTEAPHSGPLARPPDANRTPCLLWERRAVNEG